MPDAMRSRRPAAWSIVVAFLLLYVAWGTTYFAIRKGVHDEHLPPALFGGTRVCLAGLLLLIYQAARGKTIRMPLGNLAWVTLSGMLLFVAGNGLVSFAMDHTPSGVAAVLVATTALWMALAEYLLPHGDRLSGRGWLGLFLGLAGVMLLVNGHIRGPLAVPENLAPLLLLLSSFAWSIGALVVRHRPVQSAHLVGAAYQMAIGGGGLALVGLAMGETSHVSWDLVTPGAVGVFVYLLVVGSLVGFVAFNWLLGHVSAPLVGTHAYVNPLVAVLLGWGLGGENLTAMLLAGMALILAGVALVRAGRLRDAGRPALVRVRPERARTGSGAPQQAGKN